MGVLEPIRVSIYSLCFQRAALKKQALEENTQNNVQKNHTYLSCARKLIIKRKDLIEIVMNKNMVEVYIEVLRDVFQNLEGAENVIKQ